MQAMTCCIERFMKPTTNPLITAMREIYVPAARNRGEIQFTGPSLFWRCTISMDYTDENGKSVIARREAESMRLSVDEFSEFLQENSWYARFAGVDYDSGDFGPVSQPGMNTGEESSDRSSLRG